MIVTLLIMPLLGIDIGIQFNNTVGKYAVSSFCFMIALLSYLEGWIVIKLSSDINKRMNLFTETKAENKSP